MHFLKAEQKRIKEKIGKLQQDISPLVDTIKATNSQRIGLYIESICIDGELKPLLTKKVGLDVDFATKQEGLKLKRKAWEGFKIYLVEARSPTVVPSTTTPLSPKAKPTMTKAINEPNFLGYNSKGLS